MGWTRKPGDEWLDEDLGSPAEVESALRSIGFVNRRFGGERVHRLLLAEASAGRRELEVLEVAAGRATSLASAGLWLGQRGVTLRATLLDRRTSHLPDGWPQSLPAPRLVEGDALNIPLADRSVDVVSCCLFLHHLGPAEAAVFLKEAVRVARVAVVVNDLERTRVHYGLARFFALFDRSRISRHDGPVSVRQAYSAGELRAMLAAAGGQAVVRRRFLFRLAGIVWVQRP